MQPNYKKLVVSAVKAKYPYLLLGATVLLIVLLFLTGLSKKNKMYQSKTVEENSTQIGPEVKVKKYTVKAGDTLWSIAEASYGSGFNYTDIASANRLENPSIIEVDQELVIPEVNLKPATVGEINSDTTSSQTSPITLKGDSYEVKQGDYLWEIAQKAYGDGFAWVKIAKENNLSYPSLIHPGNVLKLPR